MFSTVKAIWIFVLTSSSFVFSRDIEFRYAFEGPCNTNSGKSGWCLDLKLCPAALKSIISGLQVKHCGFEGAKPIVCCPLEDGEKPGTRISKKDEVLPPRINFDCGKRTVLPYEIYEDIIISILPAETTTTAKTTTITSPFTGDLTPSDNSTFDEEINVIREIAGGIPSLKNSWPWMALLGRRRGPNFDFFCSGILINENFVITAAHCILDLEIFYVRLGEHDYDPNEGYAISTFVEDFNVTNIVFHPNYELTRGYDDIALLELDRKVEFRAEVNPICLPWGTISKEELLGEPATVTGWGIETYFGYPSSVLREVNITVFHPRECEKSYSTLRDFKDKFPRGMTIDNIICAGDQLGGKDACEGDSGGPIMHHDPKTGKYELAGIISTGYGCGKKDFPGIYAPLERLNTLQWIKNVAFQL